MSQARLAPIPGDQMNADQRRVADALIKGPRGAVRGPFPALLRRPELADRVRTFGDYLRGNDTISFEFREVAILTVARFWDASYEWGAHFKIASEGGVDAGIIKAIREKSWPSDGFKDQKLIHDFCIELLDRHDISERTYSAVLAMLGEESLVDLIAFIGYFSFACMIFNTTRMSPSDPAMQLQPYSS
jgi:4-carboxymuconolactone decarboxylase